MSCPFVKKDGTVCGKPEKDQGFCGHHSPEGRLGHAKARRGATKKKINITIAEQIDPSYQGILNEALRVYALDGLDAPHKNALRMALDAIMAEDSNRIASIRAKAESRQGVVVNIGVLDTSTPHTGCPDGD